MSGATRRRDFLLALAGAAALPSLARAFPISLVLGPGNRGYVGGFVRRLQEWREASSGPLLSAMSGPEREYCREALATLTRWDLPLDGFHAFERVLFSHKADGKSVSHARFAIAPETWPSSLRAAAERVARARGAGGLPEDLFGFGWDLAADAFKVYRLHDGPGKPEDRALRSLSSRVDERKVLRARVSCVTYRGGRPVERKWVVAHRALPDEALQGHPYAPAAAAVTEILRDSGERDWHFRLKAFNLLYLEPELRSVALRYRGEFALLPRTLVAGGAGRQALYYP